MIHLYRIGADVEFVLGQKNHDLYSIIPMNKFLGVDRVLSSYIGTDAHSATGEIRPPASHNISTLLYKIGFALATIDTHLTRNHKDSKIFGSPYCLNEPLGGHIHLSFFTRKYPHYDVLLYDLDYPTEIRTLSLQNKIPTSPVIIRLLSYLILPFEGWIQPWNQRVTRMENYGLPETMRHAESGPPRRLRPNEYYYHLEYRVPSTWIIHPTIAYCYLALAKLVLLNTEKIAPFLTNAVNMITPLLNATPNNSECKREFFYRLNQLQGLVYTSDLLSLQKALRNSDTLREHLWADGGSCKIDAWRKLLL